VRASRFNSRKNNTKKGKVVQMNSKDIGMRLEDHMVPALLA
jgi:hypothetical protein